jgi:phosphoenolpyruvate carboxylase
MSAIENAGPIMRGLLHEPAYRSHLSARNDRQIVLIGYSESTSRAASRPRAGRCRTRRPSCSTRRARPRVKITLFHARGGTAARGGGRTEHLVESAPPGAINGILRLTEQGDVVNQSYGLRPIAMRTLERTFAAVMLASAHARFAPADASASAAPVGATAAQRGAMDTIAARSLEAYRSLVFDKPRFFEYFRAATPLDVIERMHIGSRPAARAAATASTRCAPIPWVFAWTQSRHMLPGWYGFGSGLEAAIRAARRGPTRGDARRLAVFRALARRRRGDAGTHRPRCRRYYDALAGEEFAPSRRRSAASMRSRCATCCACAVTVDCSTRSDAAALDPLRNPYIDPMHLHAGGFVEALARDRARGPELFGALRATISGIAQGLQATG